MCCASQALWVELPPSPGGWSPAAATLRAELKAALGRLLSDLYIRNCRRSFAPPEAFHVSSLPPERFHAEVSAASVAEGGLMEATHTRVWSLLEYAPRQLYQHLWYQSCPAGDISLVHVWGGEGYLQKEEYHFILQVSWISFGCMTSDYSLLRSYGVSCFYLDVSNCIVSQCRTHATHLRPVDLFRCLLAC